MRVAILVIQVFPRSVIFSATEWLAFIGFYLFRGFRLRSTRNMQLALGDKFSQTDIQRMVQTSLRNFFYSFAEIPISLASRPEQLRRDIAFAGREHLDAALAKGNGVILLSAHLGNFFLLGTRLALSGYRTHVLVNQPRHGRFAQLMDEYRSKVLQNTIHARPRREALRYLVQVLRRNELAVIIADEYRRGNHGIRAPFFGRAVLARRGPVTLALRTGAAVVPALLVRGADNRLTLIVEPELELIRTGRDKTVIVENTAHITRWVERIVGLYPDQWNWITLNWQEGVAAPVSGERERIEQLPVSSLDSEVSRSASPARDRRPATRD
jgi:KDO2-lipid IV(A) lauroyltransferase